MRPELEYGLELMAASLKVADYHPTMQETLRLNEFSPAELRRLQRLFEWDVLDPPHHLPTEAIPALIKEKLRQPDNAAYQGLLDPSPRFDNYSWSRYGTMKGVAYGAGLRGNHSAVLSILRLEEQRMGGGTKPSKAIPDFIDLIVLGAALGDQMGFLVWLLGRQEIQPYLPDHDYLGWFLKGALLAGNRTSIIFAQQRIGRPLAASLLDYVPPESLEPLGRLLASSWPEPSQFYLEWLKHRIRKRTFEARNLIILQVFRRKTLDSTERVELMKVAWKHCSAEALVRLWGLRPLPPRELALIKNYCLYQLTLESENRDGLLALVDFLAAQGLDLNMWLYQATIQQSTLLMEILLQQGRVDPDLTLKALGRQAHPSDRAVAAAFELHTKALKMKIKVTHPSQYSLHWEQIAADDY